MVVIVPVVVVIVPVVVVIVPVVVMVVPVVVIAVVVMTLTLRGQVVIELDVRELCPEHADRANQPVEVTRSDKRLVLGDEVRGVSHRLT